MKLVIEILISLILHPIAVILVWLDLLTRTDIGSAKKVIWGVVALVWGLGPILYILVGDGDLW
jgi:hypothetical protein